MKERLEAVAGRPVSRETIEKLRLYEHLLREENERQNLVSRSSFETFWDRHIADSAQLMRFESAPGASWADIGSGAGLPGVVIACLTAGQVTMIEPRRLRVDFLHKVVKRLELHASVLCSKVEHTSGHYDMITARAVAALPKLLEISQHLSTRKTVWALPKGRKAMAELADARRRWQGVFHVEPSVTDDDSFIVVASEVTART